MTNKIKKEYFFLIFLILSITTYLLVEYKNDLRINEYLEEKSNKTYLNYEIVYNNHKKIADLIFKTHINKKIVLDLIKNKDRVLLEDFLKEDYEKFKEYSIRQLHFHLPNNDSFLRMHRPKKFGDNLTKDRATVRYVNENKKYIHGFEEGKIFNGFRFVYPLFNGIEHLGSVEISFNALFFIKEMMKNYNTSVNFYIDKLVVDEKVFADEKLNYIQSPFDRFYFQKSIYDNLKNYNLIKDYSQEFKTKVIQKVQTENIFSLYVDSHDTISTFIPIQNPVSLRTIAFLQVNTLDETIKKFNQSKFLYLIALIVLIAIILTLIYKQISYQLELRENIENKTKELSNMNHNLEDMIQKELAKSKQKDEIMIAQSRHAAMGEMISMIAHQWRQPISVISMGANNIMVDVELGLDSEEDIEDICKDIIEQTDYLTKTIDDFRDFFKPTKELEKVDLETILTEALNVVGKSLEYNDIEYTLEYTYYKKISTYSRELLQVIINLLKNAKDALVENQDKNRYITIKTYEKESKVYIEIEDNAGGINIDLKDKIFEPYFSTKDEKTGTGLGLYMSKIIVEKHLKGILRFENKKSGVSFILELPEDISKSESYV